MSKARGDKERSTIDYENMDEYNEQGQEQIGEGSRVTKDTRIKINKTAVVKNKNGDRFLLYAGKRYKIADNNLSDGWIVENIKEIINMILNKRRRNARKKKSKPAAPTPVNTIQNVAAENNAINQARIIDKLLNKPPSNNDDKGAGGIAVKVLNASIGSEARAAAELKRKEEEDKEKLRQLEKIREEQENEKKRLDDEIKRLTPKKPRTPLKSSADVPMSDFLKEAAERAKKRTEEAAAKIKQLEKEEEERQKQKQKEEDERQKQKQKEEEERQKQKQKEEEEKQRIESEARAAAELKRKEEEEVRAAADIRNNQKAKLGQQQLLDFILRNTQETINNTLKNAWY